MREPTQPSCPKCKAALQHQGHVSVASTLPFAGKCEDCQQRYAVLLEKVKSMPFPKSSDEFIEGVHYYLENGNWVFTETYHLLRGYCCENNCRHCVYGYGKKG